MGSRRTGRESPCPGCGKPVYRPACMEGTTRMRYCNKACVHLAKGTSADPVESFWLKVDKTGANGCWLYTGFRKWDGYGWLARKLNGKMRYLTAHRYAWILTHGQPADGMHIMHQCDNPPCCNPAHLKLGTHQENMADMVAKGRANGGQANKPKLWPDRVRPVKEAA